MDDTFLWIQQDITIDHFIRSAQSASVVNIFPKFLHEFDLIIEIGTFTGAFTHWIHSLKNIDCRILSLDINDSGMNIDNVEFIIDNCFNPSIITKLQNEISNSGKTLVLCDGGEKELEFNLYSKYLKSGDVIMLHDYAESQEEYDNIKQRLRWPTPHESSYKNIKSAIELNGLIPYNYEDLKNVLWGSFIKK